MTRAQKPPPAIAPMIHGDKPFFGAVEVVVVAHVSEQDETKMCKRERVCVCA